MSRGALRPDRFRTAWRGGRVKSTAPLCAAGVESPAARRMGQGRGAAGAARAREHGEHPPFHALSAVAQRYCKPPGTVLYLSCRKVPMAETETKSIFDIPPDEALEARLDAEAWADYKAGRVISHERMCEWLTKLARGERVPPPEV